MSSERGHRASLYQEEVALKKLRQILLQKDREELEYIRRVLDEQDLLSERVSPIVQEHLDLLKQHFPREFQIEVEKVIDIKLRQSQEELINIIYPKLGQLIKKYIANEIQKIRERVEAQVKDSFVGRMRHRFTGIKESDRILSQLGVGKIEEIYIIQRDSGLLLANASSAKTMDKDMIAGMLTAIKAFAEDAFKREEEELQSIQYGTYELFIHTFYSFYFAFAINGSLNSADKSKLSDDALQFAERELQVDFNKVEPAFFYRVQRKLEEQFLRIEE